MKVRPSEPADRVQIEAFLAQRHSARVARLGQLLFPLDYPALVAEEEGRIAGVLTYVLGARDCEILTLHAAEQWRGTGTRLIEALEAVAERKGCERLFVITTNDNVDALRFYQRRGFSLAALHREAVLRSRAQLKPEIPMVGNYGISLRDEVELEKRIVEPSSDEPVGYGPDLAVVHDRFFGELAQSAAALVIHELRAADKPGGLVVDLGCGSGILARYLTEAGYEVLGVDISADMIHLARQNAPAASFAHASLLDVELPSCAAVTAVGECLNYAFDTRNSLAQLGQLFRRVYGALEDRGFFVFDVAGPGRLGRDALKHTWHEKKDWCMHMTAVEDDESQTLTRDITPFSRAGGLYRRSDEHHLLRLYEPEAVAEELMDAGFEVCPLDAYGQTHLGPGWAGFLARKAT